MVRSDAGRGRLGAKLMRYDLDVDMASYRRLMHDAWLLWRVVMDDYELRNDPGKPARHLPDPARGGQRVTAPLLGRHRLAAVIQAAGAWRL